MVSSPAGPVTSAERSLAPDVARGLALLGIAVANSTVHVTGAERGAGSRPADGSGLDRAVDLAVALFVDARTLPVFALLFGYGSVVVLRRQEAAGATLAQARGVLLRRYLWLGVFGAAHLLLLFFGDVLLGYAVTGLVLVAFLLRTDRTLLRWAGWLLVPLALAHVAFGLLPGGDAAAAGLPAAEETALGALAVRALTLVSYPVLAPLLVASTLTMMLLGVWAARRRVLEAPQDHLPLLRRLVLVCFPVSVLGGLGWALVEVRLWRPGTVAEAASAGLHGVTGVAGGVGFAALVALAVGTRRLERGTVAGEPAAGEPAAGVPAAVRALRAVGARSLTCYLAQSVLFVLPLAPWAGGLGVGMSSTQVVAWAVGVWGVTVVLAVALEAAGRTGPAEALLRRLVHGPRRARPGGVPPGQTPSTGGSDHPRWGRERSPAT